jgi:hypothetical protein
MRPNNLCLPSFLDTYYPFTTHVSVEFPRWEPRRFEILKIRDLASDPISVAEFLRRPMTRRSRYLLRVRDLDQGQLRSVYHRSMADWFRETPLRIGIYHGCDLQELLKTNYGPTIPDRQRLVRYLNKHQTTDMGEFRLAVLSDDGEVITCESLG